MSKAQISIGKEKNARFNLKKLNYDRVALALFSERLLNIDFESLNFLNQCVERPL